jgi:hypothetical protein
VDISQRTADDECRRRDEPGWKRDLPVVLAGAGDRVNGLLAMP